MDTTVSVNRLNVGCGEWPFLYWTNLDMDPGVPADIHAEAIGYLSSCAEGAYDEIYAGHVIEHLAYDDAKQFLAECYRVLPPGGKLGVVVPDTREIIRRWLNGDPDMIEFPMKTWWPIADLDAVNHLFLYSDVQGSRHQWAWEARTLYRAMERAGFVGLVPLDRYRDPRIVQGAWYQCGLDGFKPQRGVE